MATRPRNRGHPIPRSRQEELDDAKKVTTDYISELRKGLAVDWDVAKRENIIRDIVLPKQGGWRGLQDPHVVNSRPPRVHRHRFRFANNIPSSPGLLPPRAHARLQSAVNTAFRLERDFTPAHVTFRKLLGYGGHGVAALFGLHDSTGKETRVVVKADLRPSTRSTIITEKKNMILMSGAKHVVQRTLLTQFPWPKDVQHYDYVAALGRVIIKLVILPVNLIFLVLLILMRIIKFLVQALMGLIAIESADGDEGAQDNADRDPADDSAADPRTAQPVQPPGFIASLASCTWSKLWPDWPAGPEQGALGIDGAIRKNRKELDNRQDIICMEFLRFGDLSKLIAKMTRQNDYDLESIFPEKLAWTIFECLWRGCIALAYPKGFYQGKNPSTTQIPQMTESSDDAAVDASDPLVHFDLDPQNSMICAASASPLAGFCLLTSLAF